MRRIIRRPGWLLAGIALVIMIAFGALVALGTLTPAPSPGPVPLSGGLPGGPGLAGPPSVGPATQGEGAGASPAGSASPSPPRPSGHGQVATRITIPGLGIDLPIYQGDGYTAQLGKVAHYPTSAWPGSGSMIYLYAHARDHNFIALWQAKIGDRIQLQLVDGSLATYQVSRIDPKVRWDDLSWLDPTPTEVLRLQTCNSYQETAPRFIVEATPVAAP